MVVPVNRQILLKSRPEARLSMPTLEHLAMLSSARMIIQCGVCPIRLINPNSCGTWSNRCDIGEPPPRWD